LQKLEGVLLATRRWSQPTLEQIVSPPSKSRASRGERRHRSGQNKGHHLFRLLPTYS